MTNLKGYITNTDIDAERVIAEYHGLWEERVFRISKGTLEMYTPCFTLQKEGLRHMYAPASSSAKYTRNWRDLLALTRLR